MPYIVYVFTRGVAVPYMEVLAQTDIEGARKRAFEVMAQHRNTEGAELWLSETLIERLRYRETDQRP